MMIVIALFLASAAAPGDKVMVQRLEDDFSARANAGDAAGVAALYADNAVILPPNAPSMEGRPQIQSYWAKGVSALTGVRLTTTTVRRVGPAAIEERGTYAMMTKGPSPQQLRGKYVVNWQKVGGAWKLQTDIWN